MADRQPLGCVGPARDCGKVNVLTATMPSGGDGAASAALRRGRRHVYSDLGWKDGLAERLPVGL